MESQVARYLKTAELYDWVLNLISEDTFDEVGGRGAVQGVLDAILSMGKIEGRMTALHADTTREDDRLIDGWQRIVEAGAENPDSEKGRRQV